MVAKYTYNTFHDTRGYYAVHEIRVPVEGKGREEREGGASGSHLNILHATAMPEGVSRMPTCRCIKFHVASSDILKENESEHWLAKKEEKRKRLQGQRREGEKKWKEEGGGEIEKLRGRGKNCGTNGMEGGERRLAGITCARFES